VRAAAVPAGDTRDIPGMTAPAVGRGTPDMSPDVTVVVNGEERTLEGPVSVDGLVAALGLERRGLAVAVNGEVVPRSTWTGHDVVDGDQVEILTIAQGG
jgi:sulfur carrier protein